MENAAKCSTCGTAEWEWEEDPFAYHPVFHVCKGCQKRELLSSDDAERPKGTTVRLVDKVSAERIEREQYELSRPERMRDEDG